ncbi:MAG TPA: lipoyl(octanoyl) transferase LipB [Bacteroidales bacterium]|nr:lipoyl(octanoyl) transferase LipB [Bacteroidales bacterium]HPT12435.1 lipoyl(octanoyl) transferase LipB [Bacteroidales bacterium]
MKSKTIYDDLGFRDYKETWDYQERFFREKVDLKGRRDNDTHEPEDRLIFVEHNHVYTLGKSGQESNLLLDYIQLRAKDAVFYHIDRGGDITYHGPGQLVGYPIFDIEKLGLGLKDYIHLLEEAVIKTISHYGIKGERLDGATGVWIDPASAGKARKICAIGVKASRYITMHGFALNVNTDLSYFNHINPCGFTDKGVTSIARETGREISMNEVKNDLKNVIGEVFGIEYL